MKQFSELIKNFDKIRDYMRDFYVFGFKTREDFDYKSLRSYDNEKRRIESYLCEYMSFRMDENSKSSFISVDSGDIPYNPFYKAFKAKSFTKNDIPFHFILMDILYAEDNMTLDEIMEQMEDDYLSRFSSAELPDVSTIRKKLGEYAEEGLVKAQKTGRTVRYSLNRTSYSLDGMEDLIMFFSEASPLGVVGSYLLDKTDYHNDFFTFKHHYIMNALESEIMNKLLIGIREHRAVCGINFSRRARHEKEFRMLPLKILVSAQTGRQYVAGFDLRRRRIFVYRIDYIRKVNLLEKMKEEASVLSEKLDELLKNCWGTSTGREAKLQHLEIRIRINDNEQHIPRRLLREGRQGTLSQIAPNEFLYSVELFDLSEITPFLRTFIGKIVSVKSTDEEYDKLFMNDLAAMYALYEV